MRIWPVWSQDRAKSPVSQFVKKTARNALFNIKQGPVHTNPPLIWSAFVAWKLPAHVTWFCTLTEGKSSGLYDHIDLRQNKYGAKDICWFRKCFCAFTTLWFCENHCWLLERFQNPQFMCVYIDSKQSQKPLFLWTSTFASVFENLRFCCIFAGRSMKTFT